jgi:eukaryotic-like serine/threonine-protein kinase
VTPDDWRRVTAVFHDALAVPPEARDAFLDGACPDDPTVRAEVDRLLASHQQAGAFGAVPGQAFAGDSALDMVADSSSLYRATASPDTPGARPGLASHADGAPELQASPLPPEVSTAPARRQPFLSLVWLAAALGLVMFTSAAWQLVLYRGAAPDFGWTVARRGDDWIVTSARAGGPAGLLRQGDRLLEMTGVVPFGGTSPHRRSLSPGDTYDVTIERQGQRMGLDLVVGRDPAAAAGHVTYFLISLVWWAVGLVIGLARPEQASARLASAASVMTGLNFLQATVLRGPASFHPMHVVAGTHFFCRFPSDRPVTGIWKWALGLMYLAGAIPVALGAAVQIALRTQGLSGAAALVVPRGTLFALRGPIPTYVFYASLPLMITAAIRNYRGLTDENDRRRVRWVAFGGVVGLTPQVVASVLDFASAPVALPGLFVNAFTVVIPLAAAYAIVRHRVFGIAVVVRRGLQYLLARRALQAAVALPFLVLVSIVATSRHLTIAEFVSDSRAYLYWLAAAGLLLWFRQPIRLWLDRRFFREAYDRERLMLEWFDDVRRVDSIAQLSQRVNGTLDATLHPRRVWIWYRDPHDLASTSASDPQLTPPTFPARDTFMAWLEQQRDDIAVLPLPDDAGLHERDREWFIGHDIRLIVRMTDSEERVAGALLLGGKQSEEPYSAGDRALLTAVAKQAAVVRENLHLRARVDDDARVRHDVLARLDGGLRGVLKECPACGACFDGESERCTADGTRLVLSLPVSREIDGKYRLDRLLGRGGMGAVYEACDVRLDRPVAVKIMPGRAFGQRDALRRFRREAQAAARLAHPNIVAVHDVGSLAGEGAYLVMERVQGETLRAELARCRVLSPAVAAEWFDPLLDGLAAAHAAGIVHRDLKPENVMGGRLPSGALVVKILDLGLAKFGRDDPRFSGTMTATGLAVGTLGYMSPEQRRGGDVDERTDVYAVGVMVVEALTGQRPFERKWSGPGPHAQDSAGAQLRAVWPEAHALHDLLDRCVAAEPPDRTASASALRALLIPALTGLSPAPVSRPDMV